ncbi:DUF4253 domain-containing protein [Catenulispora yoronensis]
MVEPVSRLRARPQPGAQRDQPGRDQLRPELPGQPRRGTGPGPPRRESRAPHPAGLPFAALAPGARGSDVLSTLGWTGPINYNDPIQSYSVVMRAWEDEFDARVVMLMGDSLGCCVGRPPTTFDRALTLAHQQLAFCPDLAGEFGSVNNHAASLINRTMWHFWWD